MDSAKGDLLRRLREYNVTSIYCDARNSSTNVPSAILWWNRFGPLFAADIRRRRIREQQGARHWRWHLDEMFVRLNGEMVYLWRAVDHEGEVLES
jgi:transposase-like protein